MQARHALLSRHALLAGMLLALTRPGRLALGHALARQALLAVPVLLGRYSLARAPP